MKKPTQPPASPVELLLRRGLALHQQGRLSEAQRLYSEVMATQPRHFDALYLMGVLALQTGRGEQAAQLLSDAVRIRSSQPAAYFNLGIALQGIGRSAEALSSYDKAIALRPDYAEAHVNRGALLGGMARAADALLSFERALALRPDLAEAHNGRGNALLHLGRSADALVSCDKAIALKPDLAEAHYARGNALSRLGRPDDALASYDRALALKPDYAEAHGNRGMALQDLNRPADALEGYDRALTLKPALAEAHSNRGNALQDLNRLTEALQSYDRALALDPALAEAHANRGLCLLLMGHLREGFRECEWRRKADNPIIPSRSRFKRPWLGEQDIAGQTLFLYWEQGLGDTIQLCRYAKLAEARGATVILAVQKPLHRLLQQLGPGTEVIVGDQVPAAFDYYCPLLSLPLAFGTTLETIPAERRYIRADEALRRVWSARLPAAAVPRVGLVWSGNPANRNDRNRSIKLQQLLPLFTVDVQWVSLQKDVNEEDQETLGRSDIATFHGDDLADFSDTAALIDQLDLVVTVDTSVAHLAGAMGKPVWILLPFKPDWRWLSDRDDTAWYPSARLFRQSERGSWADVVQRIMEALESVVC